VSGASATSAVEGRAAATGLSLLRSRIRAANVPAARPGNLRLATWNVRELGKGTRLDESIELIAEIVSTFDLVSIVELRDDLRDLGRVLHALGSNWQVVFSDYRQDAGGNRERVGFLYDRRRVAFTGLASNAEGPRRKVGDEYEGELPWWRPPFLASFRAGSFDFILLAAHLRWGPTVAGRAEELAALGRWIVGRTEEAYFGDRDVIAVGDFNIASTTSAAFRALTELGFATAPGLEEEAGTDLARGKRYDQILCLHKETTCFSGRAGAVDFYSGDHRGLFPGRRMSKDKFTFQVSDHLPLWAEIVTRTRAEGRDWAMR
jgi:endonuclease/exonuclease/phosphatase family metal-dependent hydrolase